MYLGVTIFALVRSCRRVDRLETTRFLTATRVGVWIAVASGTFLFSQGAFWLSLGSNMIDLCSNTTVYVGFTFFVLYRPWIPGEHRRGICAVVCVAAHLHGFEEDSRSEVVFWIDEWSTAFGHHGLPQNTHKRTQNVWLDSRTALHPVQYTRTPCTSATARCVSAVSLSTRGTRTHK